MNRACILCRVGSALLLTTTLPLPAETQEDPGRDWLAPPPASEKPSQPTPRNPRFELFPWVEDTGIPDENGISSGLREDIRRESERVLNQVSDELSTL